MKGLVTLWIGLMLAFPFISSARAAEESPQPPVAPSIAPESLEEDEDYPIITDEDYPYLDEDYEYEEKPAPVAPQKSPTDQ